MYSSNRPIGPQVAACDKTHAEKHRLPGESFREAVNRIAAALNDSEAHFREFREILMDMRFAAGGRIQAAMGSGRNITAYNCFVGGDIADSFVDGEGNIMQRAAELAATMRMGGGVGNNFSTLRPFGAMIKKLGSPSSGPLPFMDIFNAVGKATSSSGHRRGAQMGVLDVSHPDIVSFIHAKQNQDQFKGFNFSIGITDEFMEAKAAGKPFKLRWGGDVYREIDPNELWEQMMRSTWDWGEPGVLFLDTINRMNPLYYCEVLRATNPCGEQPLPPFGACLLGSFILVRYIYLNSQGKYEFNWEQFEENIPHVVRALDNVIDRAHYPLPQQKAEALSKRRMGLGVTGLANAGEALGFPYGSPEFIEFEAQVLDTLRDHAYAASARLAKEKGAFPLYNAELYTKGLFFQTLSPWVQEIIKQCGGLRNSHLTSIAPTGTMSFAMDNVSSGIEPVFSYSQERDVLDAFSKRTETVEDYGVHYFGVRGKRCSDVTINEHLNVLATAAKRVDSAVSKTCNVSPHIPWEDFKKIYDQAWALGCKGVTTFNPGGKRFAVLRSVDMELPKPQIFEVVVEGTQETPCNFDPKTGRSSCE
jgi:ribonucleoside-diphosphate reductase alpha chain